MSIREQVHTVTVLMSGSEDDHNSYPPLVDDSEDEDSEDETLEAVTRTSAGAVAIQDLGDIAPPAAAASAFLPPAAAQHAVPPVPAVDATAAAPNPQVCGAGCRAGGGRGRKGSG